MDAGNLNDVWYLPEGRHQPFSIRQAVKRGNIATFNSSCGPVYSMNIRVCAPDSVVESNFAATEEALHGWHERLSHQDKRHVRDVLSRVGISGKCSDTSSFCDGCKFGKSHRKPFHPLRDRTETVGELIDADVNGAMSTNSINGFLYYVVFKDFSRFVRIFFMKEKSEVTSHLDNIFE
ncbi:hypothetical protein QE152_g12983 [Popillia japonica]|uniref:GAG-pre-integrase domain-containing protein n=1 Tax=Popillia japonica TaxID=7064 RepID=A0AAW1LEX5_POPJA